MKGDIDCERCGKRRNSFRDDPVGDPLTYLCEPHTWANKIMAILHNAKVFDLHYIVNRVIMLKWKPELITNGLKIISMKMEHLVILDDVSFLPCALRKLPDTFDNDATKSWYPITLSRRKPRLRKLHSRGRDEWRGTKKFVVRELELGTLL